MNMIQVVEYMPNMFGMQNLIAGTAWPQIITECAPIKVNFKGPEE